MKRPTSIRTRGCASLRSSSRPPEPGRRAGSTRPGEAPEDPGPEPALPAGGDETGFRRHVDDLARNGRDVLYEYFWERAFPQTPTVLGVRGDRYKLIRFHGVWEPCDAPDDEIVPARKPRFERVSETNSWIVDVISGANPAARGGDPANCGQRRAADQPECPIPRTVTPCRLVTARDPVVIARTGRVRRPVVVVCAPASAEATRCDAGWPPASTRQPCAQTHPRHGFEHGRVRDAPVH